MKFSCAQLKSIWCIWHIGIFAGICASLLDVLVASPSGLKPTHSIVILFPSTISSWCVVLRIAYRHSRLFKETSKFLSDGIGTSRQRCCQRSCCFYGTQIKLGLRWSSVSGLHALQCQLSSIKYSSFFPFVFLLNVNANHFFFFNNRDNAFTSNSWLVFTNHENGNVSMSSISN